MSGTAPDPIVAPIAEAAPIAPEPVAVAAPEPVAPPVEAAPVAEPTAPAATSLLSEQTAPDPLAEPEAPPELPPHTYEAFTWPEGIEANDADLKPYTDVLAAHRVPQEAAQALIDLYLAEQTKAAATQRETWDGMRAEWKEQFAADPVMGGNRQQTTLARCTEVIDRFAGSPEQAKEFRDVLALTGAGDHPATIRILANIAKAFSEGKPVPAAMARGVPTTRSAARSRYPSMNGAA